MNLSLKSFLVLIAIVILTAAVFSTCGEPKLPIEQLQRKFKAVPAYSVILDDMKDEGGFFMDFFHRYRIVQPESSETTEWMEVPEKYYRLNEPFLGMALFTKTENQSYSAAAPPGYHYVGNTRYGSWRDDGRGGSFWEFYGKYRVLSDVAETVGRVISRDDYHAYQSVSSRGVPFYGRQNEYGTNGSYTKTSKPTFFERRMAREKLKQSSFAAKVRDRIGRTKTSFRGGSRSSGSFGGK